MRIRAREIDLRRNHFWIAQMMTYDRHDWDWSEIPRSAERVAALDPERIRAAAARFLDMQNYVRVTLLPEGVPAISDLDPS